MCINVGILAAYLLGLPYSLGPASVALLGREVDWWCARSGGRGPLRRVGVPVGNASADLLTIALAGGKA